MKKKRAVIFGAGGTGRRIYNMIKEDVEVVFFVDNDFAKWSGGFVKGWRLEVL